MASQSNESSVADSLVRRDTNRRAIVELDPNHPGFRDPEYRARRNAIAQLALDYVSGTPVPRVEYSPVEHDVWRWVCDGLLPVHRRHACRDFLEAWDRLQLPTDHIPQLEQVSAKIEQMSGFRLEPVAGLVEPREFLLALENNTFLSTQYIRHPSTPSYTPEPDVVHELAGHAAQLACPRFAALNRRFGEIARVASDEVLALVSRVYWFTVEFGVVREQGEVKAYGAGLLSSFGELERLPHTRVEPFDLRVMETREYDVTRFQEPLFCAESIEQVVDALGVYLG